MNPLILTFAIKTNDPHGLLTRIAKLIRATCLVVTLRVIPAARAFMAPSNLAPRVGAAVSRGEKVVKGAVIVRDALHQLAALTQSGKSHEIKPAPRQQLR